MTLLQQIIKDSDFSNTELAYKLGISELSLYRKETGKSRMKRGEMSIICDTLGISDSRRDEIMKELETLRRQ